MMYVVSVFLLFWDERAVIFQLSGFNCICTYIADTIGREEGALHVYRYRCIWI